MVDYAPPSSYQFPARTPIAQPAQLMSPRQDTYAPSQYSQTHARRRTSSSGVFPVASYRAPQYQSPLPVALDRQRMNSSSDDSSRLQRSASAVSSNSGTSSYVATLRRQKATVWCEKAQPEDARLIAAQRAARERAAREVVGSSTSVIKGPSHGLGSGSSSTTSLRGHHKLGKATTVDIGTTSLVSRPPPRLSATEATGDSSDEDDLYMSGTHRRSGSGSGRSSFNSNHRSSRLYSAREGDIQRRTSRGSTGSNSSSKSKTPSHPNILEETSPEIRMANSYFEPPITATPPPRDKAALKRSGSVDEGEARTMTMSGLRLVVANPD